MSVLEAALDSLAANIESDLKSADKHVVMLAAWDGSPPEGNEIYAAAMLLHHLYGAIEAIIERSLNIFDGVMPEGPDWHVRLLELASHELSNSRPVILPQNDVVDELRRFRHLLRKRYSLDLEPERLAPLIHNAVTSWPTIREHLLRFLRFVRQCAQAAH